MGIAAALSTKRSMDWWRALTDNEQDAEAAAQGM